jgi:hypothetical protein
MNKVKFEVRCDPSAQEIDLIFNGLAEFNESRAGDARFKELGIWLPANLERLSQVFWATHFGMDSSSALFGSLRPFDEKESDNSFLREPKSSPFKMVATTFISIPSIFRPEIFTRRTASKYSVPLRTTLLGTRDTT